MEYKQTFYPTQKSLHTFSYNSLSKARYVRQLGRREQVSPCSGQGPPPPLYLPPYHQNMLQTPPVCGSVSCFIRPKQDRCKKTNEASRPSTQVSHRHIKTQKVTWSYHRIHYTITVINLHCGFAPPPPPPPPSACTLGRRFYNLEPLINMSIK